jgi:stearoyl-CoA desaturase (delta-9 desaturase)
VFFQSFFLHRYGAHRMFSMSRGWQKAFHFATYVTQGSSYLNPRAYAILHRLHHAHSDTPLDPHSPTNHTNALTMMWITKQRYDDYAHRGAQPEARFDGGFPQWDGLDRWGQSWASRILWMFAYTGFYWAFATSAWQWLLLPLHFVMGPLHGAIVNWCGHRYGYRNYDTPDQSRNTLLADLVTMGELFQNNHHRFAMSPNFASRRFELDPTYQVMRVLVALRIIRLRPQPQVMQPVSTPNARAKRAA